MRITITLDEDVYQLVSLCAYGRGITLGAAVGEFVRRGIAQPASGITTAPNGLPLLPARGRVITPQMVKDASGC
jgi:hypothetical protein